MLGVQKARLTMANDVEDRIAKLERQIVLMDRRMKAVEIQAGES